MGPGGSKDDHADQSQEQPDGSEKERRRQAQRAAAAVAAVQGAGGGGRARALAARRGGAQGLGVHQAARAAEPGEPARDPGRQQAGAGVREEEGDHVRYEQAPGAAPEINPGRPEVAGRKSWQTEYSTSPPCYPAFLLSVQNGKACTSQIK